MNNLHLEITTIIVVPIYFYQNFNNYVIIFDGTIDSIHTIVICISNDLTHHNILMLSLPLCNKEPIPWISLWPSTNLTGMPQILSQVTINPKSSWVSIQG